MIGRRIEQLYGFGAARVALSGHAFNVGDPDDSLRRAGALLVQDLRREGWRGALGLGSAPLLGLALIALLALATLIARPADDHSDIELVPFELARAVPPPPPLVAEPLPVLPPVIPEPVPEPRAAKPEREPAPPPPVAQPKPRPPVAPLAPPPPPQMLAQRPPPAPPAPKPAREPAPAPRPRVQIDQIARTAAAVPPPPPAQRTRRAEQAAEPRPAAARVALAPLAAQPAPAQPAARERFRVAQPSAPAAPGTPRLRVDPMRSRIDSAPSDPPSRASRRAPARVNSSRPEAPRPDLAVASLSADAPREASPRARTQRVAPAAARAERPAAVEVAALGAPASRTPARSGTPRSQRVGPAAAPASARRSEQDEDLRGVPLGSLAACHSDADEDALKQQVVATVTTQKECLSGAGHYRFLQTRNLNSFLMWVDRAAGRGEADRCIELRHALDCLKRSNRTES